MKRVAIIGAGISGLFIANLLKKNPKYEIKIYEKNKSINLDEGYGIQLSVNSVKLLNEIEFNLLNDNEKFTPEKLDFYLNNKSKICELNLSDFNLTGCKYTTLKRSVLINFLCKNLKNLIEFNHNISKIEKHKSKIKLSFENRKKYEYDYLIISDGVFSKCKDIISNGSIKPNYNNTLAIRGIISKKLNYINNKNISLILDSNFHQVIYPINTNEDLNYIGIMKYHLKSEELKNYSLFNDNFFIEKVLKRVPKNAKEILDKIKDVRIFPIFVSKDFYKFQNDNIHIIGDAFFAFPPSFAQGASQSIEAAYDLFKSIENNTENIFFANRLKKTKMVRNRSRFNQFAFHLSNPLTKLIRNFFLKKFVKNRKFLENYLGKIYRN